MKQSDLKIGSAARAEIQLTKTVTGDYLIPTQGDEMFDNPNGAPSSLYNWDDARPIPVFGREPDALAADGRLVPKAKIPPMLVHRAYVNDFLERRHKLNIKQGNLKWGIFGFLIALAVIFDFAILFYSYYFGINVNCALHTKACP